MNSMTRWICTSLFAVAAIATASIGQPVDGLQPTDPRTQAPGDQPVLDPNNPNGVVINPADASPDQVGPDTPDDSATQPSTEPSAPSTEPTTQEATTEPGTTTQPVKRHVIQRNVSNRKGRSVRWSGGTSTAPSAPTTRMTQSYQILESRSIFVRGHAADMSRSNGPSSMPTIANAITARPESTLMFSGVTITADTANALVEDTISGHVTTVKSGDSVASGKVFNITLDSLEYDAGGKRVTVMIGQNFEGSEVTAPPVAGSSTGSDGAAPAGVSNEPPGDIIERLRRKRAAEMGGGK